MATRDTVRASRSELAQRMRDKGISTEDLDTLLKGNPRLYSTQALTLVNQAIDTPGRYRIHREIPPAGAFDGVNKTFSLTAGVLGRNIAVDHVIQATGVLTPLALSDNPSPPAGAFYLDVQNNAVVVGQAPDGLDTLAVTYFSRR